MKYFIGILAIISFSILSIFGMKEQNVIFLLEDMKEKNDTIPTLKEIVENIRKCFCGLSFDDHIQIKNHVIEKYRILGQNRFKCEFCAYTFEFIDFLIHCATHLFMWNNRTIL